MQARRLEKGMQKGDYGKGGGKSNWKGYGFKGDGWKGGGKAFGKAFGKSGWQQAGAGKGWNHGQKGGLYAFSDELPSWIDGTAPHDQSWDSPCCWKTWRNSRS